MVLLEAMTAGLPAVAFDCPTGPAEVIRPGVTGLLVPPQDVDGLAAGICDLIEHPARRKAMGAAARTAVGALLDGSGAGRSGSSSSPIWSPPRLDRVSPHEAEQPEIRSGRERGAGREPSWWTPTRNGRRRAGRTKPR
jgi:hypothetical protein